MNNWCNLQKCKVKIYWENYDYKRIGYKKIKNFWDTLNCNNESGIIWVAHQMVPYNKPDNFKKSSWRSISKLKAKYYKLLLGNNRCNFLSRQFHIWPLNLGAYQDNIGGKWGRNWSSYINVSFTWWQWFYMTRKELKDVGFSSVASVKYVDGSGQICQFVWGHLILSLFTL